MLVKVSVLMYDMFKPVMYVRYKGIGYSVSKSDVVRDGDDIAVDDSKLTEQTKIQTSYR